MTTYKIYDPENKPVFFNSLTDLRQTLELTAEEIKRVARTNTVATLDNGEEVIVYRN